MNIKQATIVYLICTCRDLVLLRRILGVAKQGLGVQMVGNVHMQSLNRRLVLQYFEVSIYIVSMNGVI
jgi:hypothetical protein